LPRVASNLSPPTLAFQVAGIAEAYEHARLRFHRFHAIICCSSAYIFNLYANCLGLNYITEKRINIICIFFIKENK
jgi:hypothetical protein